MPSTGANIFMLKTLGRWRESQVISHEGPDGEPLAGTTINAVQLYLPDNGRDQGLSERLRAKAAPPMKTIEHIPMAPR